MWFTIVTMTTVGGYAPESPAGQLITSAMIIVSVIYLAMPIGIIGNAFTQVWTERDRIHLASRTYARLVEWGYTISDIPKLFREFDRNKRGELTLSEFRNLVDYLHVGLSTDRLVELFETLDVDGSGSVGSKEFMRALFPGAYHDLRGRKSKKSLSESEGAA